MSKKNQKATTENKATELEQGALDKPSMTSLEYMRPALTVLGDIMIESNDNYQSLVSKSQTLQSAKEAGKTLREISKQYAKVLIAALEYPYDDLDADTLNDELDFEDEDKSDVDFLED